MSRRDHHYDEVVDSHLDNNDVVVVAVDGKDDDGSFLLLSSKSMSDDDGGGGGTSVDGSDDDDGDSFYFTEEMHYRSSTLMMSKILDLDDDVAPTVGTGTWRQEDRLFLLDSTHPDHHQVGQQPRLLRRNESWKFGQAQQQQQQQQGIDLLVYDKTPSSPFSPSQQYQTQQQQRQQQQHDAQDKDDEEQQLQDVLIHNILQQIDEIGVTKRIHGGFNEVNFTMGVLNVLVVVVTFLSYPQHFWILFVVEGILLVTVKAKTFWYSKPFNNVLYLLDYCWVMNILALLALILLLLVNGCNILLLPSNKDTYDIDDSSASSSSGPDRTATTFLLPPILLHKYLYMVMIGTSCGPLLGACYVLPFVCCLFHDVNTIADLFIHIFPPMVAYTFMWEYDTIQNTYPRLFQLVNVQPFNNKDAIPYFPSSTSSMSVFGSIMGSTITLYFIWFVLYLTWMLTIGLNLPRSDDARRKWRRKRSTRSHDDNDERLNGHHDETTSILPQKLKQHKPKKHAPKYDTVFHSLMRGGLYIILGSTLFGRSKAMSIQHMKTNSFEVRDLLVYLSIHAMSAIVATIVLGYLCYTSQMVHSVLLVLVTVVTVYRGANRYTYYVTEMYGATLRKQLLTAAEAAAAATAVSSSSPQQQHIES